MNDKGFGKASVIITIVFGILVILAVILKPYVRDSVRTSVTPTPTEDICVEVDGIKFCDVNM